MKTVFLYIFGVSCGAFWTKIGGHQAETFPNLPIYPRTLDFCKKAHKIGRENAQKTKPNPWIFARKPKIISVNDVLRKLESERGEKGFRNETVENKEPVQHFMPTSPDIRPYQWNCVRACRDKSGFVVAPCGSGKTLIGLLVAVFNGGRFLVLTTRFPEQWKKTLESYFLPFKNEGQTKPLTY